jgi:hypothetical protein
MEHKELCKICGKPIRYGVPHVGHSPPFIVGQRKLVHPILNCPVKGCAFYARMQSTIKGHLKSIHGMGFRGTSPIASSPPSPHHYPTDSQPDPVAELGKQMESLTIPKGGKRNTLSRRQLRRSRRRSRSRRN